jgi:hypothetical protein
MNDICTFGNEDLSHTLFIKMWNSVAKLKEKEIILAEKTLLKFHELVKQNKKNINIVLESLQAETAEILTEDGWVKKPVDEVIDMMIKKRAGQLLKFRHLIL